MRGATLPHHRTLCRRKALTRTLNCGGGRDELQQPPADLPSSGFQRAKGRLEFPQPQIYHKNSNSEKIHLSKAQIIILLKGEASLLHRGFSSVQEALQGALRHSSLPK